MPGPPKLPSEVKKLRGTFREHRDGAVDHQMDELPAINSEMPSDLTGKAAELWNRVIPSLASVQIVREVDIPIAAGMCRWYKLWFEMQYRVDNENFDTTDIDGERHAAMVQRRATDAWKNFCAAAGKLGLSPSDRAKIRADDSGGGKDNSDPLSYFGIGAGKN